MRSFVGIDLGIDLGIEGALDETTICKFRHLLEGNKPGNTLLEAVNEYLRTNGITRIRDNHVSNARARSGPPNTGEVSAAKVGNRIT